MPKTADMFAGVKHGPLVALARRIVGANDAEDVVQMAYLKFHRSQSSFRGDCALQSYLGTIVRRCALDVLEQRKRRPAEPIPDDFDRPIDDPEPLDRGKLRLAGERFETLSPLLQEAMISNATHESRAQAAAALGITEAALKARLRRARVELRR